MNLTMSHTVAIVCWEYLTELFFKQIRIDKAVGLSVMTLILSRRSYDVRPPLAAALRNSVCRLPTIPPSACDVIDRLGV